MYNLCKVPIFRTLKRGKHPAGCFQIRLIGLSARNLLLISYSIRLAMYL
nr:MAG TPA_asm: hypothetical protein [Caudoviricetes sp.]